MSNCNHYSLLHVILNCLELYRCKIVLFIPKEMEVHASSRQVERIAFIDNRQFTSKKIFDQLNTADFIIVDQLYSLRELISFSTYSLKKPNLLIVHDCNSWFKPQTPLSFINKIKNKLTAFAKKNFNYFAVAGMNMQSYIQDHLKVKNSIVLPFRYADFNRIEDAQTDKYIPGTTISIVVPGMITSRRRYRELIENLMTNKLKGKIELVLLGKPKGSYGDEIIELVKEKLKDGFLLKYWTSFIPTEIFNQEIKKAHILFSEFDPIYYTDNGQKEIYGITKETGISLLMLNKAKVGLLPQDFKQMESILNQTLHYSSLEDLSEIIEKIFNGEIDLTNLTQNALENASLMDIESVALDIEKAYLTQLHHA